MATMPPRPAENEDPWFAKRDAWDAAVEAEVEALPAALAGKAAAVHTHAAADVVSGVLAPARLGSGTPDNTKFLRGDQTWAAPAGGGGGSAGVPYGYQRLKASQALRMFDAYRVDLNQAADFNRLWFLPVYIGWAGNTFKHFYTEVGTAAAAGGVVRFGMYAVGADGRPGPLVVDAGTVPSTATGTATLSHGGFTVPAPGLYFLAVALQGAAGAKIAWYVSSNSPYGAGLYGENASTTSGLAETQTVGYQDAVTGALPAVAAPTGYSNTGGYVALRVD